ncbi:carbohydrate ABC transporter permease [Microbacterium trichothecenolyticum]|uniref:Carbohydrate ABC transporter permease n=1 Tax=Microbacterium ureisolvens TaxID=2781186 RepID=A0ABS7I2L5_9MICO|nr:MULTISPECIES: carbohydrate ABC transporter permease [Microbacterium]MBW9111907.1 carbohydrate ABC transporter permease [Microbacterium ureisolvens]MBW9122246.1 carbohydrate ABC transporter permease [Microbacterium trichothecenolyticum]
MSAPTATRRTSVVPTPPASPPTRDPRPRKPKGGFWPTVTLLVGAAYSLFPVYWLVAASTKSAGELFTTSTLVPSFTGGFFENLGELLAFGDGAFLVWSGNSILFSVGGGLAATAVAAAAGYALAKYDFRGKNLVFTFLLIGVLIPGVVLAIPQYLLLAKMGIAGTYWSVLLPFAISPFSIYLARIYAGAVVPTELLEAGRLDGASEWRLFRSVALPAMVPGLITIFLLQFVAIWNNFLLPFIMLSREETFPLTVGFYSMMNQGSDQLNVYNLVIVGCLLAIIPLILLFLFLQRYWRLDLVSGSLKG